MKQRGVALIIVLLVVALVSVVATEMGSRLQLQVKRAANLKDSNQAYWYAMGAEQYARIAISKILDEEDDIIHINQPWAQTNLAFPLPGGGIEAELIDMHSCFNLNALQQQQSETSKAKEIEAFHRLLTNQSFEIAPLNAETLRDSLVDWLDEDTMLFGSYGAEDPDYESLTHPYLAANAMMINKSELRLVKGAELPWLLDIMPLVCAIPNSNELKINVNTLKAEHAPLLAALTGMSNSDAQNIIGNIPYEDRESFLSQSEVATQSLTDEQKNWFQVTTQHFILYIKSRYNNAAFKMSSVLEIDDAKNIKVIRREFGGKI